MQLRAARLDDARALTALAGDAVRAHGPSAYEAAQLDAWVGHLSESELCARIADSRATVWVAEQDGVAVGFAALVTDELDLLYVAPEAGGRGVGRALLASVEAEVRRTGHRALMVAASMNASAFYESQGFVAIAVEENEAMPGVWVPRLWMRKPLA